MVDAYCKRCDEALDGDEYGITIKDYHTKDEYLKELQEFHDNEYHKVVA